MRELAHNFDRLLLDILAHLLDALDSLVDGIIVLVDEGADEGRVNHLCTTSLRQLSIHEHANLHGVIEREPVLLCPDEGKKKK